MLPIRVSNTRKEARLRDLLLFWVCLDHIDAHRTDVLGILLRGHSGADERPVIQVCGCSVFDDNLSIEDLVNSLPDSLTVNRGVKLGSSGKFKGLNPVSRMLLMPMIFSINK